jgi:ribosomal protein L11 methyltransferase
VQALVPSARGRVPAIEQLDDEDWVTMSQAGLAPLHVGRFYVHTAAQDALPPEGARVFRIEAGRAFGTGHHETTSGCLAMLDGLAERRFGDVVDIGTGTGLLAFAARELWPEARVLATDIDPVAIDVTRENAVVNAVAGIDLVVADGALADAITDRAPYDLLIANILAGPLVSMAPEVAAIAAPDATVVLAGLLGRQASEVISAYAACGCTLEARDDRGDWTILRLRAGAQRYVPTAPIDPAGRDGWALDI